MLASVESDDGAVNGFMHLEDNITSLTESSWKHCM